MYRVNYYKALGVGRLATRKEIKKAFTKLAKKYHPDLSKGDSGSSEKFLAVTEAYQVLSDKFKRRRYDMGMSGSHYGPGNGSFSEMNGNQQGQDTSNYNPQGNNYNSARYRKHQHGDSFIMFNVDAWEAAHGLGKYSPKHPKHQEMFKFSYAQGMGQTENSQTSQSRKAKGFADGSRRKLSKHQEFFLRQHYKDNEKNR
uniref:J domain-containing protein n=1 Tax=Aplanochytrium stocchinoi TaxID=215587 RepID=A0A7S3UY61_9STRA|mmetsp:Transcript_19254/g.23431  ORF Transcript_19254/g.23431 Transcript_19254/m.23431 type:complete len:199 (+) Transcript_19254:275-871(+)|eukprot:CAMPEP_0204827818 /NCGR_PEP_ID=MMETSP1346-20131115/5315_1 /ASSEMBLY_ACC=CAM_ASM_000771 /TAXON_ID=215587 /ORGANISM="Aplanochytrium stocchinoi, Strain GSBS06" /LENGTH=198 /DNA_ID=CAMNT_0051956423 /DNA_START=212 /DNA_END=808 /DNA_ORIENTATION=-